MGKTILENYYDALYRAQKDFDDNEEVKKALAALNLAIDKAKNDFRKAIAKETKDGDVVFRQAGQKRPA